MLTLALFIIGIALTAQSGAAMQHYGDNLPRVSILFLILGITALYAAFYTLVSPAAAILGTVVVTPLITMIVAEPVKKNDNKTVLT